MMRTLLCLVLTFVLLPTAAAARETGAEHAANLYTAQEAAAAPVHANLPDYSLPPESLRKAQHLASVRERLHFSNQGWDILELLLLLQTGAIAWMRDRARRTGKRRWIQGLTFALLFLAATTVLGLPLEIYQHSLSLRYGLSIQRWPGWFLDQAKEFLLAWLIGGPLLLLLFWVIRKAPRTWWFAFWLCTIPISIVGMFAMPYVEPVFFHYEPLAQTQPELVQKLREVVARGHMDIPPERMFLMRASAKLTTLNADVEGFGHSKRVVVWDTAVNKFSPDQILFVFGHESGHYVLGHLRRGLALETIGSLVLLFAGFHAVRYLLAIAGPRWRIPAQDDWGAVAVLLLVLAIFNAVTAPVAATLSRMQEHDADVYGMEAIHGLVPDPQHTAQTAFQVLGATSFDDPNPPRWYELLTFGHPAVGKRAAFAHAYDPWRAGNRPKYFPAAGVRLSTTSAPAAFATPAAKEERGIGSH